MLQRPVVLCLQLRVVQQKETNVYLQIQQELEWQLVTCTIMEAVIATSLIFQ